MKTTDEKRSMELGELYRDLRVARGLKLKDVAKDNLSVSQLSKFENGQTMLSADRLLIAIDGIHMSFEEFGHALRNYELPNSLKLDNEIKKLFEAQDIDGLKELLKEYSSHGRCDIYKRLNTLVIKESISSLDPAYPISDEEIEFLVHYLYEIDEWTEYELYIFGNTLTLLSTDDLIFLGKAFVERDKLYRFDPAHELLAKGILLNIIAVMIEKEQFYYTNYFIDALEKLITVQDLFYRVSLNFMTLLIACIQGEKKTNELKSYLDALLLLGEEDLVHLFQAKLQKINR